MSLSIRLMVFDLQLLLKKNDKYCKNELKFNWDRTNIQLGLIAGVLIH